VAKGAPADFVSWKARAAADLKRQHNVNPGIIPARMWKHLYIQGHSSQRGAALVVAVAARRAAVISSAKIGKVGVGVDDASAAGSAGSTRASMMKTPPGPDPPHQLASGHRLAGHCHERLSRRDPGHGRARPASLVHVLGTGAVLKMAGGLGRDMRRAFLCQSCASVAHGPW
jgi:hypothetical protein